MSDIRNIVSCDYHTEYDYCIKQPGHTGLHEMRSKLFSDKELNNLLAEALHPSARDIARQICNRRGPETVAEQVGRAAQLIESLVNEKLAGMREQAAAFFDKLGCTCPERHRKTVPEHTVSCATHLAYCMRHLESEQADAGLRAIEERAKRIRQDEIETALRIMTGDKYGAALNAVTEDFPWLADVKEAIERRVLEKAAVDCVASGDGIIVHHRLQCPRCKEGTTFEISLKDAPGLWITCGACGWIINSAILALKPSEREDQP